LPPLILYSVVCKHWLRGLCKKGENCEFLHEYNLRRMPACTNYARYLSCPNGDDCLYQHVPPEAKRPLCPWYERGFCPLGPLCANRHVKRDKICELYLAGFCPDGKRCRRGAHPRYRKDADMKKPQVWVPKTPEELEREREEREREVAEQAERDRELREERGPSFAGSFNIAGPGGPPSGGPRDGQQRFGGGKGGGHWKKGRKRGGRQRGGY
jgi:cleavage and polyadenylation specificity factor subunit 4